MVASGVAEIALPQFWGSDPAQVQNYADVGANLIGDLRPNASCGWVVDLRKNYGGNMMPMLASVSALLTQGHLISFVDRDRRPPGPASPHRRSRTKRTSPASATQ